MCYVRTHSYCCLHQNYRKPDGKLLMRTQEDQAKYNAGLKASSIWFGHKAITVWFQPEMPRFPETHAFERSGWCTTERAISQILKKPDHRLDLSKHTAAAAEAQARAATQLQSTYRGKLTRKQFNSSPALLQGRAPAEEPRLRKQTSEGTPQRAPDDSSKKSAPLTPKQPSRAGTAVSPRKLAFEAEEVAPAPGPSAASDRGIYQRLRTVCEQPREPPLHPDSLKEDFERRKIFTHSEDKTLCSFLYEDFFDEVSWEVELLLNGLTITWTPFQLRNLVRVLPEYKRCSLLDLSECRGLGNAGCKAVCDVLRLGDDGMASLKELRLTNCGIKNAGAIELSKVLPNSPEPLVIVDMHTNYLGSNALFKLKECAKKKPGLNVRCPDRSTASNDDDGSRGPKRKKGYRVALRDGVQTGMLGGQSSWDSKLEEQDLGPGSQRKKTGEEMIERLLR